MFRNRLNIRSAISISRMYCPSIILNAANRLFACRVNSVCEDEYGSSLLVFLDPQKQHQKCHGFSFYTRHVLGWVRQKVCSLSKGVTAESWDYGQYSINKRY